VASEWDLSPGAVDPLLGFFISDDPIYGTSLDHFIAGEGQSFDCHAQSTAWLRLKIMLLLSGALSRINVLPNIANGVGLLRTCTENQHNFI